MEVKDYELWQLIMQHLITVVIIIIMVVVILEGECRFILIELHYLKVTTNSESNGILISSTR